MRADSDFEPDPDPDPDPEPEPEPEPEPQPFWLRRGAEDKTDQGSRLSERSEFERDPVLFEHRRLPVAQRRDAASRVAFSFGYFTFGEAGVCQGSCRLRSFSGCPFWNWFLLPFWIEIDSLLKLPVS